MSWATTGAAAHSHCAALSFVRRPGLMRLAELTDPARPDCGSPDPSAFGPDRAKLARMPTPSQPQRIQVMLVDDHAVVREGLGAIIATEGGFELAASVGSVEEARLELRSTIPDLMLLDLLLGDGDGLQLLRELKTHAPHCIVLMLSSALDERQAKAALALGATGYLTKDMAGDDLIRAMKGALRGELQLSPKLDARRIRHGETSATVQLSTREGDVLQLLAEGLANAEIAVRLGIGEATVKTHVGKLLAKLGVSDRTQAAIYAWRHGLVREQ